jgi:hypothetical protein
MAEKKCFLLYSLKWFLKTVTEPISWALKGDLPSRAENSLLKNQFQQEEEGMIAKGWRS